MIFWYNIMNCYNDKKRGNAYMKNFAVRKPIVFELILIIVSFILTVIASLPFQILYFPVELTMALARIIVGCLLFVVFLYCFKKDRQFSSIAIALPALLFVIWNIANHFMTGGTFNAPDLETIILAAAPAVLEEVLFRDIFIYHLKENGMKPLMIAVISALLFALSHLSNAINGNLLQALIQTVYAFVIGFVFGTVYTKTDDLMTLILIHGAIDLSSRIFESAAVTPVYVIVLFIILLILETAYALWLSLKKDEKRS